MQEPLPKICEEITQLGNPQNIIVITKPIMKLDGVTLQITKLALTLTKRACLMRANNKDNKTT